MICKSLFILRFGRRHLWADGSEVKPLTGPNRSLKSWSFTAGDPLKLWSFMVAGEMAGGSWSPHPSPEGPRTKTYSSLEVSGSSLSSGLVTRGISGDSGLVAVAGWIFLKMIHFFFWIISALFWLWHNDRHHFSSEGTVTSSGRLKPSFIMTG